MYYDLAQTSLVKTPISLAEMYIPLWVHSSNFTSSTSVSSGYFVQKGSFSVATSATSATKLHTLNSSWQSIQQFAFEASIYCSNGNTAYAALWDITVGSIVSSSQLSTASTTATVLRSSQFTLIPGHIYGITIWSTSASYHAYLSKAHLIAFLS